MRALITGGAGFIGSHLADRLLAEGHEVRALDDLDPQVHEGGARPDYLDPSVELTVGDVRDRDALGKALEDVDAVVHFAAAVGVGQSMYEIERYTAINSVGCAVLLEEVVARREWDVLAKDGTPLVPEPTSEEKPLRPTSVYAVGKRDHEELTLAVGAAYGIPAVALRFFNVYGARQALSNPYTGVAAIFASRLMSGAEPLVFEDGKQTRDFIDVRDITRACSLALQSDAADGRALNVGTGKPSSVLDVADALGKGLGVEVEPRILGEFRAGDIRHCYADTRRAEELLRFRSEIAFVDGMRDLLAWLETQEASDQVEAAYQALADRRLTR
jgi:dTDP-L-rhamnose 4-epimerase